MMRHACAMRSASRVFCHGARSRASPSFQLSYSTNVSPTSSTASAPTLPEQLRSTMRLLTNPVVVLTSHSTVPRGMTMSSFTSLSLHPTPLVTFNIATPSRTLDAVVETSAFNIHILSADEKGAAVAEMFTKGNEELDLESLGVNDGQDGVRISHDGRLEGDGILAVLKCKIPTLGGYVRVRESVVVVGEVLEMVHMRQGVGLGYSDRAYRRLGDVIKKHDV